MNESFKMYLYIQNASDFICLFLPVVTGCIVVVCPVAIETQKQRARERGLRLILLLTVCKLLVVYQVPMS